MDRLVICFNDFNNLADTAVVIFISFFFWILIKIIAHSGTIVLQFIMNTRRVMEEKSASEVERTRYEWINKINIKNIDGLFPSTKHSIALCVICHVYAEKWNYHSLMEKSVRNKVEESTSLWQASTHYYILLHR